MKKKICVLVRLRGDGSIQELYKGSLKDALARMDMLVDEWGVSARELSVHPC